MTSWPLLYVTHSTDSEDESLKPNIAYSVIDTVVEEIGNKFPEVLPASEAESTAIKREFYIFLMSPVKLQDEVSF